MKRRAFCVASLGGATLSRTFAQTATWPDRPIRLLIGYPPGGSTDVAARLLATDLSTRLKQPIVVDNRPGASGTIAAATAVRAEPDGYTFLLAAAAELTIAPSVMKKLSYDPLVDLTPVSMVGHVPYLLVVSADKPVKSVRDLIELAKRKGKSLNFASYGNNSSNHLLTEYFCNSAGFAAVHIPYKGSGPALTDLMGGQVDFAFDTAAATLPFIRSGKLRALAACTSERLPMAADIPTLAEQGHPVPISGSWFGMLAAARTPVPVVEGMLGQLREVLREATFRKAFLDRAILIPDAQSPGDMASFLDRETATWRAITARLGVVRE